MCTMNSENNENENEKHKLTSTPSTQRATPTFTYAEMWQCFDADEDNRSTGDGKLVRPQEGKTPISSSGSGPLCFINIFASDECNNLIVLLSSNGLSVCRASDFSVLGFFPASGERVIS